MKISVDRWRGPADMPSLFTVVSCDQSWRTLASDSRQLDILASACRAKLKFMWLFRGNFCNSTMLGSPQFCSFDNTCYIPWYCTWCLYSSWLFDFQCPGLTAWYSVTRIFMYILSKLVTSKFLNVYISKGYGGPDILEMWLQGMQSDACQIIMCQNWHNHNSPLSDSWLSLTTLLYMYTCAVQKSYKTVTDWT